MPEPVDATLLGLDPDSELSELLGRCPDAGILRFRDEEYLIQEGERSRDILVVTQGGLVVERRGDPPVVLAQMSASAEEPVILGEMAYFGEEPRSASVRAVGSTLALRISPQHVDLVLDGFPGLTRMICRQFTQRLREASQALAAFRSGLDLGPERRMLKDGEALFQAGEPARFLFQLAVGRLRIEDAAGTRSLGPEDFPGGFIELEPWLRSGTHGQSAWAEGSVFLAAIGLAGRAAFLRRYPDLALAVFEQDRQG